MPQPLSSQRLGARIERLPEPIPAAWALRVRLHTRVESLISRIQRQHYRFRDTVAWPTLRRLGVDGQLLDNAHLQHAKLFDTIYDTARTAHWYV